LWFGGVPVLPHVQCGAPSGPPATLRTMPDGRRRAPVASCPECPPPEIASGRAAFLFDGPVREAIHRMKFRRDRRIGDVLGAAMAAIAPPSADGVVWVPLSRAHLAERGFDQALALARSAARRRVRGPQPTSGARPARGRRPYHRRNRRNRRRVRRDSPGLRLRAGGSARRCSFRCGAQARGLEAAAILGRALVWVCGCPGSVSPVVDASRGRSDPRKATLGC